MAGFAIRDEMNGIAEAPGKLWFWELEEAVIDAGRCIQCGACIAACPSDSIGVGHDDLPALVKMCTGCSLCWDFCPRGGLRYEATWDGILTGQGTGSGDPPGTGLGAVAEQHSARVVEDLPGTQDGGVVSALLIALLEEGAIDGAVVAREDPEETWKGVPYVATTPGEVRGCGGSFYNQTLALGHLDLDGYDLPPDPRLALVGTPCEVQGLRAMQARPWTHWGTSHVDAVVLTVALLCTKSFDYRGLMLRELRERRGLDLDRVGRVDVIRGRLVVDDTDGRTILDEPIRDFHGAALKGCDECADFLGYGADISVGSVGSTHGYSSVLVRTAAGRAAFDLVRPRLELRNLEAPDRLLKLQATDRRVALEALRRPLDPDGPLFVEFDDHVAAYAGSDRAPVRRAR
ncbi:MAG TPA: Coenzyme F420 hydrogenase/dehydrogenase, beta subunit C-terminal domain [Acidimicrobiales bacterium]|nr:Coenzyme F420 hydrogenase/dehydrogenase, beta subunit C-terminal domain [Acidimicrobiales bacterium]